MQGQTWSRNVRQQSNGCPGSDECLIGLVLYVKKIKCVVKLLPRHRDHLCRHVLKPPELHGGSIHQMPAIFCNSNGLPLFVAEIVIEFRSIPRGSDVNVSFLAFESSLCFEKIY